MGTIVNGVDNLKVTIDNDHDLLQNLRGGGTSGYYHLSLSDITAVISGVQGDIVYHNGTGLARLNASTSGYVLETRNSGYDPIWVVPSGGNSNLDGGTASSTYALGQTINAGGAS